MDRQTTDRQDSASHDTRHDARIGLFDSGVGGLSIYQHIHELLPNENYLYFADTKNVPYGGRQHQDIIDLTLQAVGWLYQKGCKLIVIACNSASAHGLEVARCRYPDVLIVGLVPALKPAVQSSQTKHVAVLATQATLQGKLLNDVIDQFAKPQNIQVSKHFNPNLVPWVEAGMPINSTATELEEQIQLFYAQGVDQLVLGCTHYPFFRGFVEEYLAKHNVPMQVVDSGRAIALRVRQLLQRHDLFNHQPITEVEPLQFYASRYDPKLTEVLSRLLPQPIQVLD